MHDVREVGFRLGDEFVDTGEPGASHDVRLGLAGFGRVIVERVDAVAFSLAGRVLLPELGLGGLTGLKPLVSQLLAAELAGEVEPFPSEPALRAGRAAGSVVRAVSRSRSPGKDDVGAQVGGWGARASQGNRVGRRAVVAVVTVDDGRVRLGQGELALAELLGGLERAARPRFLEVEFRCPALQGVILRYLSKKRSPSENLAGSAGVKTPAFSGSGALHAPTWPRCSP